MQSSFASGIGMSAVGTDPNWLLRLRWSMVNTVPVYTDGGHRAVLQRWDQWGNGAALGFSEVVTAIPVLAIYHTSPISAVDTAFDTRPDRQRCVLLQAVGTFINVRGMAKLVNRYGTFASTMTAIPRNFCNAIRISVARHPKLEPL